MTIRYFYTDPLKAAWMARHFGMKFIHDGEEFGTTLVPVTVEKCDEIIQRNGTAFMWPESEAA